MPLLQANVWLLQGFDYLRRYPLKGTRNIGMAGVDENNECQLRV